MFMFYLFSIVICDLTLTSSSVLKDAGSVCRFDEFSCEDGACVSLDRHCDGNLDCADASDEHACFEGQNNVFDTPTIRRSKRATCGLGTWSCYDGSCISFDGKCDGVKDCADGSDETHALCRHMPCQSNWFKCAYGACVDGAARCNKHKDCADNSDELLAVCFNQTDISRGRFKCQDGSFVPVDMRCDGARDCPDGSDETLRACGDNKCASYLFQCAYGACVDQFSDCNGKQDCADNSDEAEDLCKPNGRPTVIDDNGLQNNFGPDPVIGSGDCVIPEHPAHGRYHVLGAPDAKPGHRFPSAYINVTCDNGYEPYGMNFALCASKWSTLPTCVKYCVTTDHPSIQHFCTIQGAEDGSKIKCPKKVLPGTEVTFQCQAPIYYHDGILENVYCQEGGWDKPFPRCAPDCGTRIPHGETLLSNSVSADRGEVPWHVGIYERVGGAMDHICGGSIVTDRVVISAAHCFWKANKYPPENYAVAAGKLMRQWDNPDDKDAQKFNITEIFIPERYADASKNYQEDIALLRLSTAIRYETYVRPVCLDFDRSKEDRQLQSGNMGVVAGWGLIDATGHIPNRLKVAELPYVPYLECLQRSPPDFIDLITRDKICAGNETSGTAVCKGDSGGGLAFPNNAQKVRYFLRGIVSTSPKDLDNYKCNTYTIAAFTRIMDHEIPIQRFISKN